MGIGASACRLLLYALALVRPRDRRGPGWGVGAHKLA